MPVVSRQSVKSPTAAKLANHQSSILSRAIDVNTLPVAKIKYLIFGANRVGKTSLAVQFPRPLLLISFEPHATGGADSVRRVKGVDYLHMTSIEETMSLIDELQSNTHYKTHVLDTATSLQDLVLQAIMGRNRVVEQINKGMVEDGQYVKRAEKCKDLLRDFLNLDAHTIVLAKEKDHVPQETKNLQARFTRRLRNESFLSADLGGGTAGWLRDACNYVSRLSVEKEVIVQTSVEEIQGEKRVIKEEIETGDIVRRLRCQIHDNYDGGFRSDNPKAVPEYIEGQSPEELYQKLSQVIAGSYRT